MLPFLRQKKWPRVATPPPEEKTINASYQEQALDHYAHALLEAFESRDHGSVRRILTAVAQHVKEETTDARPKA